MAGHLDGRVCPLDFVRDELGLASLGPLEARPGVRKRVVCRVVEIGRSSGLGAGLGDRVPFLVVFERIGKAPSLLPTPRLSEGAAGVSVQKEVLFAAIGAAARAARPRARTVIDGGGAPQLVNADALLQDGLAAGGAVDTRSRCALLRAHVRPLVRIDVVPRDGLLARRAIDIRGHAGVAFR